MCGEFVCVCESVCVESVCVVSECLYVCVYVCLFAVNVCVVFV